MRNFKVPALEFQDSRTGTLEVRNWNLKIPEPELQFRLWSFKIPEPEL